MCGCGSGAILEAFPIPLGSTATLFIPPALAGPCGIPLTPTFPVPAEPAPRANCANEAAGGARTRNIAKAIFAETADQLKKALVDAQHADRVTVIVVPADPEKRMPSMGTWWDVPVAEVSGAEKTQETRRRYEQAVDKQRPVLG